jgi:hypothetical protein
MRYVLPSYIPLLECIFKEQLTGIVAVTLNLQPWFDFSRNYKFLIANLTTYHPNALRSAGESHDSCVRILDEKRVQSLNTTSRLGFSCFDQESKNSVS